MKTLYLVFRFYLGTVLEHHVVIPPTHNTNQTTCTSDTARGSSW